MTTRTSLSDRFDLRGDLSHGYGSILEVALDLTHLVEERLIIKILCEHFLVLLREAVNELLDLGNIKVELDRHFRLASKPDHTK